MSGLKEHILSLDETPVHFWQGGSGEKTIVFVHGGGSDHALFSWRAVLPEMSQSYQVVAPDLPGYGLSPCPSSWAISPQSPLRTLVDSRKFDERVNQNPFWYHIEFTRKFLEKLELQRVTLVGISMGGGIALGTALCYPELVERLCLVDSYALTSRMYLSPLTYLFSRSDGLMRFLRNQVCQHRRLIRWGIRWLTYQPKLAVLETLALEAHISFCSRGEHPAWRDFLKAEMTPTGNLTSFFPHLNRLEIPVQIVHGAKDRLISVAVARRAAKRIKDSWLTVFPNCGHLPPREYPEYFCALLRQFLYFW
ncbi:MAG: alpha/beta hydrolase [Calditrichaeota bacterium]|nr:MAG: alpha/beta hydrolase [Calditrichota bacterium]